MEITYKTVKTAEGLTFVLNLPFALTISRAKACEEKNQKLVEELDATIAKYSDIAVALEQKYANKLEERRFVLTVYSQGRKLDAIAAATEPGATTVDWNRLQLHQVAASARMPVTDVLDLDPQIFNDLAYRVNFINTPSQDRLDFLHSQLLN